MKIVTYERLVAEDARRAEWRRLDEAMETRTERLTPASLRVAVGHWMIAIGARLAGEDSVTAHTKAA
ncbi:MAG: hypothetical protein MUD01_03005 [Chloroflexaceae bacterium]|jgi:hypothetical protein|nr:hypothetical protein [Chloroflexaceae bacterium]